MPSMLSGAFCLSQDRNSQFSSSCSCESRWILNRSVSISGAAGLLPLRLYHSGVVSHDDSYLVHDVHGWGCAFARPLTYQRSNFGAHFRKLGHRYDPFALGSPLAPIQALDLICQNRAWTRPGNHHFKGIVLDLRRHRAADHQTGLRVICGGAQHNCGPVPSLFMSSQWVEAGPDYVPSVGHIGLRHLQRLFANRFAEIRLVMQILTSNPLHKLGQIIFLALCWLDDDAPGLFAHVNGIV